MNNELKSELLNKAKVTLRIKTNLFDGEIGDIIDAGYDLLRTRGVKIRANEIRPMEQRCILTYVRWQFGEPDNPERLKNAFYDQLAMLMTTSDYTDWGESNG